MLATLGWAACGPGPQVAGTQRPAEVTTGELRIRGPAGATAAVALPGARRPREASVDGEALGGPPGTWRVTVARPGGRPYRAAVRVEAGVTSLLDVPAARDDEPLIVVGGEVLPLAAHVRVVSHLDPAGLDFERVAPDAFSRRTTQARVTQLVLHADLTGDAQETFDVLSRKGLSSHFVIDWDGTIHQLLDPLWRAYHAGPANDRSVGVDLNNWMRNLVREPTAPPWPPDHPALRQEDQPALTRPLSPELRINGLRTRSWGYNDRQYEALIELVRVLVAALPATELAVPASPEPGGPSGVPLNVVPGIANFRGLVAHWHLSSSRWDPGPGFDWRRLVAGTRGQELTSPQVPPLPPTALDTTSENACWHTPGCPLEGLCSPGRRGVGCRAGSDADCRRSDLCAIRGRCTARRGTCVATEPADCAGSGACREWGFCRLVNARCVPDDASACERWPGCAKSGECSLSGDGTSCVVASDADCAKAAACRWGHRCKALSGRCVAADDAACEAAPACRATGACAWSEGGVCVPATVEHCAASQACPMRGRCALVGDRCAPGEPSHCEASSRCRRVGECSRIDTRDGPVCGLQADGDCAAMGACATFGLCAARDGRCAPRSDADCGGAVVCSDRGWCAAGAERCVPANDADCAASRRCQDAGYCEHDEQASVCVRARGPAGRARGANAPQSAR